MAQFVDIEAAKEFMVEALGKISPEELDQICADLEKKSTIFQATLSQPQIEQMTPETLYTILQLIFSMRRNAKKMIKIHSLETLKNRVIQLLHGDGPVEERIEVFYHALEGVDNHIRYDLVSELLHFTFPQQYWLWTRWIWDPKHKTGALPLVITEDYNLEEPHIGSTYLKVGKAMAFVRHVGDASGFQVIRNNSFGVDAYLCCVYVVYVYTVLRMRMTQEFNQIVPGLSDFSRRLLGINKIEEQLDAS